MSPNRSSIRPFGLFLTIVIGLILFASPVAFSQTPDLIVRVGDTTGSPGEQNSVISIYMSNYADTVAGFELWLMLNRNDIMVFQTDYVTVTDTTYWRCLDWYNPDSCLDSLDITDSVLLIPGYPYDWPYIAEYDVYVGNHDTSGSLSSGWEYISSRSVTGLGYDLKVVGVANRFPPPYTPGIAYPQYGLTPLIKILADVYAVPDTLQDRIVTIHVQATSLDNFSFSNEMGTAIGVVTDTVLDTSWFVCESWLEPDSICLLYHEVGTGPIDSVDSFWCCDTILAGHLDSNQVWIYDGSLEVLQGLCGDVNGNGLLNLLDITFLINYLYKGGPEPPNLSLCDVNHSGTVNLLDITYLINYLYKGGPEPDCFG